LRHKRPERELESDDVLELHVLLAEEVAARRKLHQNQDGHDRGLYHVVRVALDGDEELNFVVALAVVELVVLVLNGAFLFQDILPLAFAVVKHLLHVQILDVFRASVWVVFYRKNIEFVLVFAGEVGRKVGCVNVHFGEVVRRVLLNGALLFHDLVVI